MADNPQRPPPLLPAVFHIMLALADGERHGYAIKQEIELSTGGVISLGPGALYGTLRRMLEDGLIDESGERPDPESDDIRRRYYRLTAAGRRLAAAEAERLESLVRLARDKRILTKPRTAS
jgi:DNA-binding PadR family transcriptional regulator